MHIQLETPTPNTIRSYTAEHVTIGTIEYTHSIIVSGEHIISEWPVYSLQELTKTNLGPALSLKPEIIIIGHQQPTIALPMAVMQCLSNQRIGIECMSIGAACRTFNVLLAEKRNVIIGLIFMERGTTSRPSCAVAEQI